MEEALRAMMQEGLSINMFEASLKKLLEFNDSAESSHAALAAFLSPYGNSEIFLTIGLAKLREELKPHHGPVLTVPYALEMLTSLKGRHRLAIVTIGSPPLQFSKLEKAGIDPSFFSKIDVIEEKNKKPRYQAIIEEAGVSPLEVVVCGDRVAIDLIPAKELGCYTVHLARGRGRQMRESALSSGAADHAIEDWHDFALLIERLETALTTGHHDDE